MFTSRAEYRLRLRADNADERLTPLGARAGCVGSARGAAFAAKAEALASARALLESLTLTPDQAAGYGIALNRDGRRRSGFDLLAFPDLSVAALARVWPELSAIPAAAAERLQIDARYAVYMDRQEASIVAFKKDEAVAIPAAFDFAAISGLSNELRQKLERHRPSTLAQASRIDGMTPAALMLVLAHIRKASRAA